MLQKLLIAAFCLLAAIAANAQTSKPHCKGTTVKGQPCKQTLIDSSGYCRFHNPNRVLCAHPGCHMPVPTKGTYCRFHQPHAIHLLRQNTDQRGLTSVQYTQDGQTWALDYLIKQQFDSLKAIR